MIFKENFWHKTFNLRNITFLEDFDEFTYIFWNWLEILGNPVIQCTHDPGVSAPLCSTYLRLGTRLVRLALLSLVSPFTFLKIRMTKWKRFLMFFRARRISDLWNSDFWLTPSECLRRERVDSKESLTLNSDSCESSQKSKPVSTCFLLLIRVSHYCNNARNLQYSYWLQYWENKNWFSFKWNKIRF